MGGTLVGGGALCKELIRIIVLRQSCLVSLSEAILTKQDDHNKLDDRTTQRMVDFGMFIIGLLTLIVGIIALTQSKKK